MDQTLLSLVVTLKERIKNEKANYIHAIGDGKDEEAREIISEIHALQKELEKLLPQKKDGYEGL